MNGTPTAAGPLGRVQVTLLAVISGRTEGSPVFGGPPDFDLEPPETHTFGGGTQRLAHRPTLQVWCFAA